MDFVRGLVGLFKGPQKILAAAHHPDPVILWGADDFRQRFGHRPLHLHHLLTGAETLPDAILGLSAFYHDSAAAILVDGQIVAAAQEERFTRKKHDPDFPANALTYVMAEAGLKLERPELRSPFTTSRYLKFERLLETYHGFAPRGLQSFLMAMPVWIKEKLLMRTLLREELAKVGEGQPQAAVSRAPPVPRGQRLLSLALSRRRPSSPWTGWGNGPPPPSASARGKDITILRELQFPHSLGLLYSAFTYYCGFKVNSGEYKLMGLAPYGNPEAERTGAGGS